MTAQIREKLKYNGKIYHLAAEPLYPYLVEHKIKFVSSSTACWRGYVGSWLIEDDHLYLVDLKAYIPQRESPVEIKLKNENFKTKLIRPCYNM